MCLRVLVLRALCGGSSRRCAGLSLQGLWAVQTRHNTSQTRRSLSHPSNGVELINKLSLLFQQRSHKRGLCHAWGPAATDSTGFELVRDGQQLSTSPLLWSEQEFILIDCSIKKIYSICKKDQRLHACTERKVRFSRASNSIFCPRFESKQTSRLDAR